MVFTVMVASFIAFFSGRGLLVTLQILTSSSFSLVKETHGSLGQCVSFSLIDVGCGFTAYVVFLFFLYYTVPSPIALTKNPRFITPQHLAS